MKPHQCALPLETFPRALETFPRLPLETFPRLQRAALEVGAWVVLVTFAGFLHLRESEVRAIQELLRVLEHVHGLRDFGVRGVLHAVREVRSVDEGRLHLVRVVGHVGGAEFAVAHVPVSHDGLCALDAVLEATDSLLVGGGFLVHGLGGLGGLVGAGPSRPRVRVQIQARTATASK